MKSISELIQSASIKYGVRVTNGSLDYQVSNQDDSIFESGAFLSLCHAMVKSTIFNIVPLSWCEKNHIPIPHPGDLIYLRAALVYFDSPEQERTRKPFIRWVRWNAWANMYTIDRVGLPCFTPENLTKALKYVVERFSDEHKIWWQSLSDKMAHKTKTNEMMRIQSHGVLEQYMNESRLYRHILTGYEDDAEVNRLFREFNPLSNTASSTLLRSIWRQMTRRINGMGSSGGRLPVSVGELNEYDMAMVLGLIFGNKRVPMATQLKINLKENPRGNRQGLIDILSRYIPNLSEAFVANNIFFPEHVDKQLSRNANDIEGYIRNLIHSHMDTSLRSMAFTLAEYMTSNRVNGKGLSKAFTQEFVRDLTEEYNRRLKKMGKNADIYSWGGSTSWTPGAYRPTKTTLSTRSSKKSRRR